MSASPHPNASSGAHVAKSFGHVEALRDANVSVRPGEVVRSCGRQRCGQVDARQDPARHQPPDRGEVVIDDQPVKLTSVRDAQALGVEAVHQTSRSTPRPLRRGQHVPRPRGGSRSRRDARPSLDDGACRCRAPRALDRTSLPHGADPRPLRWPASGGRRRAGGHVGALRRAHGRATAALGARQSEIICDLMRTVAAAASESSSSPTIFRASSRPPTP